MSSGVTVALWSGKMSQRKQAPLLGGNECGWCDVTWGMRTRVSGRGKPATNHLTKQARLHSGSSCTCTSTLTLQCRRTR